VAAMVLVNAPFKNKGERRFKSGHGHQKGMGEACAYMPKYIRLHNAI
jgi:hypothetical protein